MEYMKEIFTNKTYQILGITCDNASNNDTMVEALATIMSHFSGEANRARCLAHIVNLVAKIILRQFDMPKKKNKNKKDLPEDKMAVDEDDDDQEEINEEMLYKEEREMDDGDNEDDEDGERLQKDAEIMEEVMEGEIDGVVRKVKPVRQALFKVSPIFFFFFIFVFLSVRIASPSLLFFNSALYGCFRSNPHRHLLFFIFNSAFIVSFLNTVGFPFFSHSPSPSFFFITFYHFSFFLNHRSLSFFLLFTITLFFYLTPRRRLYLFPNHRLRDLSFFAALLFLSI